MPLNRTRSFSLPKLGTAWHSLGATYSRYVKHGGTTKSDLRHVLDGHRETFTQSRYIQDQYPSARGVTGNYTANPVIIQSYIERPTMIEFERKSAISYHGTVGGGDHRIQWSTAGGDVTVKAPVVGSHNYGPGYQQVLNEWLPALRTSFKAEAGNAAAMSLVSIAEFTKTLSLITGASQRWSSLVEKAVNKDIAIVDRWLATRKSKRLSIDKARHLGADLVKVMTDKKTFENLPRKLKAKYRKLARSAEGKLGLYLNGHMEYRYGWKTLVYDIEDHFEAAGNVITPDVTKYRKEQKQRFEQGVKRFDTAYVPARYFEPVNCVWECNWRVTAKAGATIYHDVPKALKKLHAFGLLNPLSSMYELVPLSFVSDWFANHGDLLKAAENARFNTFYDSWSSASFNATIKAVHAFKDTLLDAQESVQKHYERTTGMETSFVIFSDPMNAVRWTDTVALIWARVVSKSKFKHLAL